MTPVGIMGPWRESLCLLEEEASGSKWTYIRASLFILMQKAPRNLPTTLLIISVWDTIPKSVCTSSLFGVQTVFIGNWAFKVVHSSGAANNPRVERCPELFFHNDKNILCRQHRSPYSQCLNKMGVPLLNITVLCFVFLCLQGIVRSSRILPKLVCSPTASAS